MQKVYAAKEKDIAVKYDANGFYMEELLPGTYREVYATINVISEPEVRYHPGYMGRIWLFLCSEKAGDI